MTDGRLGCRCCGIKSPDVGFTSDGDALCDACDVALRLHLEAIVWRGFLKERGEIIVKKAAEEARKAAERHMEGDLF